MESFKKRLSMNTSLKNARIFDDDAWEDDGISPKPVIKQEPEESDSENTEIMHTSSPLLDKIKRELAEIKQKIKKEPSQIKEEADDKFDEDSDDTFEEGQHKDSFGNVSVKQEPNVQTNGQCNTVKIKTETTMEEGELEDSMVETKYRPVKSEDTDSNKMLGESKFKCKTPSPDPLKQIKIKPDPDQPAVDNIFDESPFNKDLFKTVKIKDETPIKEENQEENISNNARNTLKSAKRTVFSRLSPYKKADDNTYEKRVSVKSRLGPRIDEEDDTRPRKFPRYEHRQDMESDPEVLARREKQIEYGKNTIGYENYRKMVPKTERTLEDPKTPPKYKKYSRRGWEGLIKQWRIKLHKYDPPETADSAS